ncbi:hypothetical protein C1645_833027 [Glomus cerebriforme]|uniref:ATPase domain-containing protein n=1 Tax=Glomus cerebriforme TaxID=658196 RepID=A0A397SD77_9GLOM|nr:hypothetical protein C1645_833027 [Glomus cerebriforme]
MSSLYNGTRLSLQRGRHIMLRRFYTQNSLKNTNIGKDFFTKNSQKNTIMGKKFYTQNHKRNITQFDLLYLYSVFVVSCCLFSSDTIRTYIKHIPEYFSKVSLKNENMAIIDQQDHKTIANLIADRHKPAESYYLLIGPYGIGKTVLVTLAKERAGKGVLYVDAPNEEAFSTNLSQEIKNLKWSVHDRYYWNGWFNEFEKIAEKIRRKENYTPLLIIDNVKISKENFSYSNMIRKIQHSAKDASKHGNYNVMFIANDLKTLEFLLDDPAESNMEIIFLGDLNKDVALSYLQNHEVDKNTAEKIYEIFGGRIIDLNHVAKCYERNKENENFLNDYVDIKSNSIIYKLDKCFVNDKFQSKVLNFLYNHSDRPFKRSGFKFSDSRWDFTDDELYDKLVYKNIISMSKNLENTFGSPFTRYVFKNLYNQKGGSKTSGGIIETCSN